MKASKLYETQIAAVVEFRDRYTELINLMERGRAPGTMAMVQLQPSNGSAAKVNELFPKVARAAGAAAEVGEHRRVQVFQFGQVKTLDPIISWQHSIDMPEHLTARIVVDCCEGIIGSLTSKRDRAKAIEGTPAGWLAAFVGFPARVRSAVLLQNPESHRLGAVAFGAGVVGQVLIGAAAAGLASAVGILVSAVI